MDVPEDIREKANSVWADAVEQSRAEGTVIDVSVLIAQALLSERLAQKERDAKIADGMAATKPVSGPVADLIATVMGHAGKQVADAIRKQS
jgi:hypothetical protein